MTWDSRFLFALVVLLLACGCQVGVYVWTDDHCRERGGHTEIVYGGRGGWTCAEAER